MATMPDLPPPTAEPTGVDVDFTVTKAGAVEIQLEDGTVLRHRTAIAQVMRTEIIDQNGDRVYMVRSLSMLTVVQRGKGDDDGSSKQ